MMAVSAEAAEAKITEYLRSEVVKVDKDCIRPIQVQAFQCSAKCCQDQHSSQEVIQRCLSGCMQPVLEAEQKLKSEVEQLQARLNRCAEQCHDEYKDSVPSGGESRAGDVERAQQCLVKCCDTNSKLIPKLIAKYRASLRNC